MGRARAVRRGLRGPSRPGIHRVQGSSLGVPRRLGTAGFLARTALSSRRGPAVAAARRLPPGTWVRTMTRVNFAADIIEQHDIRVISAYNLLLGAPVGAIAAEMYRIPLVVTNFGEIYSHRSEIDRQIEMIRHIVAVRRGADVAHPSLRRQLSRAGNEPGCAGAPLRHPPRAVRRRCGRGDAQAARYPSGRGRRAIRRSLGPRHGSPRAARWAARSCSTVIRPCMY